MSVITASTTNQHVQFVRLRGSCSYLSSSCTQIKWSLNRPSPPTRRRNWIFFLSPKKPNTKLRTGNPYNSCTSQIIVSSSPPPRSFSQFEFSRKILCVPICVAHYFLILINFTLLILSLVVWIDRLIVPDGKSPLQTSVFIDI